MGSGQELGVAGELTQAPPPRTPRGRRFDLSRLGRLALLLPTHRDHGGVLRGAAGADRAVLVRLDQPGQLRRLLRLDDPELPGASRRRCTCTRCCAAWCCRSRRRWSCARARLHLRLLHQPPAAEGPAAAAGGGDRPVLDELHRAHLRLGRSAAEPGAGRPIRPRAWASTGTSTSSTPSTRSRSASSTRTCR